MTLVTRSGARFTCKEPQPVLDSVSMYLVDQWTFSTIHRAIHWHIEQAFMSDFQNVDGLEHHVHLLTTFVLKSVHLHAIPYP
jgi:hypothetical protein